MNKVTFVSVWDGDITLKSNALYDEESGQVDVLESHDVEGLDSLDEEYIELENGTRLDVCRHCHEGIPKVSMDENPNDPKDKTLYEHLTCPVCGEPN